MSTYFAATVLVVGRHEHLAALNQYILRAEFKRPAEAFSYSRRYVNPRLCAALYRSGKSQYAPQLAVALDILGDGTAALARLDFCVYLYQDAESAYSAQECVYRRGKLLVDQVLDEEDPPINAFDVFRHCCCSELSLTAAEFERLERWFERPEDDGSLGLFTRLYRKIRSRLWVLRARIRSGWRRLASSNDAPQRSAPVVDDPLDTDDIPF